jgi:hypothetical protein
MKTLVTLLCFLSVLSLAQGNIRGTPTFAMTEPPQYQGANAIGHTV